MTITAPLPAALPAALAAPLLPAVETPLCEHRGCLSGGPATPRPLFPGPDGKDLGGPRRPPSWGGHVPGVADPDVSCPAGLDACCGACGCQGE